MPSTSRPTQTYLRNEIDVVPFAPNEPEAKEALEAPSKMARSIPERSHMAKSFEFSAGPRLAEPPVDPTLVAPLQNERFQNNRPSLGRRAPRAIARFLIAVLIGVVVTLAWQSYGEAAKQMIVSWAPQLAPWLSVRGMNAPSGAETASGPPSAAQDQASAPHTPEPSPMPIAQGAPETIAPTAPVIDQENLAAIARDLTAVQRNIEQLTIFQEQIAGDVAKLQAGQQEISRKMAAPAPRPATPQPRKPPPVAPSGPTTPQISSAPLSRPLEPLH